jgi:hypothetical protein
MKRPPRRCAPIMMPPSAITMSGTTDHDAAEWAITMAGTRRYATATVDEPSLTRLLMPYL